MAAAAQRKSLQDYRTLVLNADGNPLSTWPLSLHPTQKMVKKIVNGRVDTVEEWGFLVHAGSCIIPAPKTVILRHYAPVYGDPKFCRRSILLRDRYRCFPAGTLVLMANGRQKPIEDVHVGDRVIDAYGVPQAVVATGNRIADDCVSIKHRGSFERTTTTPDHPFLTEEGFTPISDVPIGTSNGGRRGGYLTFPRDVQYELCAPTTLNIAAMLPADRWYRLRDGRIYTTRRPREQGLPVTVKQSGRLAYLLGLYVAEGSSSPQGAVTWCFASWEENLADDVRSILADEFGLTAWMHVNHEKHVRVVGVGSKNLADVLNRYCGKGARKKKAPWRLIGPYHAEFLKGLFLGDAHFDKVRAKAALTMTGHQVIRDAQSMLWGLGIYPTVQYGERDGRLSTMTLVLNAQNHSRFQQRVLGDLNYPGAETVFGDETHVYRRLQERETVEGDFVVYNIEVEGSHTYIANGLAVHNCQYCGERFESHELTYDHVIPRSRGGRTEWTNIVSACLSCNSKKANSMPNYSGRKRVAQLGQMRPLKEPRRPSNAELLRAGLEFLPNDIRETWADTLYWGVSLEA